MLTSGIEKIRDQDYIPPKKQKLPGSVRMQDSWFARGGNKSPADTNIRPIIERIEKHLLCQRQRKQVQTSIQVIDS